MLYKFKEILNHDKDKILSSIVEFIHNSALRNSNDNKLSEISQLSIQYIKEAVKSNFTEKKRMNMLPGRSEHIIKLQLYFKNLLLEEEVQSAGYLSDVYDIISSAMKHCVRGCTDYELYCHEYTGYGVEFLSFLEDKGFHKNDLVQEFYVDRLKELCSKFDTESYKNACEQLIKDIKSEDYARVIEDSRTLIETYHKHVLGCEELNNKTAVLKVIKHKIIAPTYKNKKTEAEVEKAIKSILDLLIKCISELRNNPNVSTAHGGNQDTKYFGKQHAYLFLGVTITYLNFIVQCPDRSSVGLLTK